MKEKTTALILMIVPLLLNAQTHSLPLKVGDKMPDVELGTMYNYAPGKAKTSDFKGKLLLLDLWNKTCSNCIDGFPKMERLQSEFKDKIQVILVNYLDSKESLLKTGFPHKSPSPIIASTKLPFAIEEQKFMDLFSVNGVPYVIWIYNDTVAALTTGRAVTAEAISKVLDGQGYKGRNVVTMGDLGMVDDTKGNEHASILQLKNKVLSENLLYSSVIARNIGGKGFSGLIQDSATSKYIGLRSFNYPLDLLATSMGIDMFHKRDWIVLEVDHPELLCRQANMTEVEKAEFEQKGIYAIEIKFPAERMSGNDPADIKMLQKATLREIEQYFGVKATVEKRKVPCRILVRTGKEDQLKQNGGEYTYQGNGSKNSGGLLFRKGNITLLYEEIRFSLHFPPFKPFFNETGISKDKLFDIDLNTTMEDVEKLRTALKQYGLDIVEEERELDMLVVKQAKDY